MTPTWAICMKLEVADSIGPLRCTSGLEVCTTDGTLWLRGSDTEMLSILELRSLPAVGRYRVDGDRLLPLGKRLPIGLLPDGPWSPLHEWVSVDVARPSLPGQASGRVGLSLVRGDNAAESNIVMTTPAACVAWAEHASSLRLIPLSVAIDRAQERVILKGTPLPPLPGARYVLADRVGLPAGYDFDLSISHEDVVGLLQLAPGQSALFEPDGAWSVFDDDVFVAATRSTLRLLGNRGMAASAEGAVP
jgi:hypothetical protein